MSEGWPEEVYIYDDAEPEGSREDWQDENEPAGEWSDTVEPTEEEYMDEEDYS